LSNLNERGRRIRRISHGPSKETVSRTAAHLGVAPATLEHRVNLISFFEIQPGSHILAIGGDLSMMVAKTDEQAVQRLGVGGGFFSFGIMHYYMTGMHTPGRTGVWEKYLEEVDADPSLAYGPGRGAIGSPDTVREFLRGYEESGVDEIILLLNPRSHEGTMESIELMGKEVLPEFIERDAKQVAEKNKRLEPVLEKLEKRREASMAPQFDENYSFGRSSRQRSTSTMTVAGR